MPHLETAIRSIIEDDTSNPLARGGLFLASKLYKGGVALRHMLYKNGVLKSEKAPLPVVSVGNIVAGGTGKTPFVEMLARDVSMQKKVAILTRGYRGADEAKLLFDHLQLPIYIGKNRRDSAKQAKAEGREVLILDDGMQHLAIARDVEVVVINGGDPFGRGNFLPRGYLREKPEALMKADYIVVNHMRDEEQLEAIRNYTDAPIIGTRLVPERLDIGNENVGIFCGIGNPASFKKTVEELGANVVETLFMPDHVLPSKNEFCAFVEKSALAGATRVLCTEKDWVKMPSSIESPLPVLKVGVTLSILFGEENYKSLVERITQL